MDNDTNDLDHSDQTLPPSATPPAAPPATFLRRHAIGVTIAAAALAVVVVAGGTAWGVSAAVAGSRTAEPAAVSTAAHGGRMAATHRHGTHEAVGVITAISGATWTIRSTAGTTLTVTLDASTRFGTTKIPAAASSFAVGDRVGVVGARSGDEITAKRVVQLKAGSGGAGTPTPDATPMPGATM